ncbi:MAG: glycoside hydrolase family 5 protein, partial [Oscillospiraceae bacterium]|nr:glycoside hydrolase family 5 protein [Oscillospiraceae bacterium]
TSETSSTSGDSNTSETSATSDSDTTASGTTGTSESATSSETSTSTSATSEQPGNGKIVYNLQNDDTFGKIGSVNAGGHNFVQIRDGTVTANNETKTISIAGRGGSSQALQISLAGLGAVEGHSYQFSFTGRIEVENGNSGNQDVWVRAAVANSGDNIGTDYLARRQDVAPGTSFTLTTGLITQSTIASQLAANPLTVYRFGGASQNTYVVTGITIMVFCPTGCPGNNCGASTSVDFKSLTAAQLVADIGIGWNLGNAFDSHNANNGTIGYGLTTSISTLETLWHSNRPTQNLIRSVKSQGFNTIRIPVTWYKVADPNNNYAIRAEWMARIKEVVDWAIEEDMYVILNTHHEYPLYDGMRQNGDLNRANAMVTSFWTQIGNTFRNYDEKLIFEGLNEPRDLSMPSGVSGDNRLWYGGWLSDDPAGQLPAGHTTAQTLSEEQQHFHYTRINQLNQTFVNAVRATGGNNDHRILMVTPYAASGQRWNSRGPLDNFRRPTDPKNPDVNKFALSIHMYEPITFAMSSGSSYQAWGTGESTEARIITLFDRIQSRARDANINMPVIMGEWGSTNNNNTAQRATHAELYVKHGTSRGFRMIVWDNAANGTGEENLGLFNRSNGNVNSGYGAIIDAMKRGRWN